MMVFISSALSIFLVYLSKYKGAKFCFELSIIFLILFWSIRYDFGNDYLVYLDNFDSINSEIGVHLDFEYGWILLNKMFSRLGFPTLVFIVTVFQFYSVYFYLKRYVDRNFRWFVLMFYIINVSLMIHSLSGLRQTVSMSIFLFALHYIYSRKYLVSFFVILFAAQFHSSAYFMLILPLTVFLLEINKKTYGMVLLTLFGLCFIFKRRLLDYFAIILTFEGVSRYEEYLEQSDVAYSGGGLGIILQLLVLGILFLYEKQEKSMQSWLIKLYQLSFIFVPLYTILPIFNRLQMYFLLLGMGGTPMLIKVARKKYTICVIIVLYLLMLLLSFRSVLSTGPYSVYRTIFSELL